MQPWGPFAACSVEGVSRPCLSPAASEQTAFLNDLGSRGFTPLVTGCPAASAECRPSVPEQADVAAGTVFGVSFVTGGACLQIRCGPQFVGATSDDKHVVLESRVALTKEGGGLYEWSAGKPPSEQLASVGLLPEQEGGAPPAGRARLGADDKDARSAISSDGSHVFWSAAGALYMRDVPAGKTLRVDLPEAGCLEEGTCGRGTAAAQFQLASSDGSRVLFTDGQRLTAGSGARGPDLYECKISESARRTKVRSVRLDA